MEAMLHEGSEVIRSGHKIIRAKRELHELENYINYASFLVAGGIRDPELLYYWINKAQEAAFSLEDVISMYEIWPNRRYKLHAMKSETNESGSLIKELAEIIKECTKRITEQERNSDIKARPYETSRNMPAEVDNSEIMVLLSEISLFIRYSHPVTADKVLGMDSETEQLKRLLRGNDPVLFVIGGQGSGKTTLMKIVYEDPDVKNDFPARSWVDAAKVTGLVDLLRKMLKVKRSDAEPAADATDELGIMSEIHTTDPDAIDELKIMTEIHSIIQDKRYLVVLDNVQDTCALQTLKQVLKECNGKIICLTRNQDINMEQVPEVTISGLETKEARKLFIRAAFPRFLDSTAEENATFLSALQWTADKYPSLGINASEVGPTLAKDLEDALDRCGGNPWNIWTLGTLLEANPYKWEDILGEQGMDNVLIDVKTGEGKGKQKAEKGYTNWQSLDPPQKKSDPPIQLEDAKLPPDIRRGFLYCLAFPETSGIPARKLIRLWVAEGFVQDRLLHRQEQEAESLLQKLIDKKLLVVKREGSDGEVLECSVNENIRPLASTMCELQKFCRFVPEKQHPAHQYSCSTPKSESWLLYISQLTQKSKIMEKDKKFTYTSTTAGHRQLNQKSKMTGKFTSTSITPCYRCRMLAVHGDEGVEDALRTLYRHDRLRSLLYFGTGRMQRSKFDLSFKGRYNLLRMLELQGASLAFLPPSIQVLVCLRYLGLRNTPLEDLPASLHKLNKLMCLDIRDTGITSVDVFAFEEMRHLYLANSFRGQSVRASPGLGLLIDLRTLSGAAYTKALEEELSYLELLRKLSIKKVPPTSSQNVCHAINNMEFLQSLTITCEEGQLDISSLNTGKNLRKLKLGGDMGALCDRRLTMMQSITYLYLWDSKLTDDPLLRLQGLQHLLLLCLHNAYTGQKLRCENGYRKLKKLSIISIENLNECTFGSGAMKSLEELVFAKCYKISSPPQGIEHITSLQVVKWSEMPLGFSNGLNTGSIKRRARVEEIKMHYHRSTRAATEADPALRSDLGAQDTTQDTKSGDGTAVRVDLKRPSPTAGLTPYSRPDRGRPARLRLVGPCRFAPYKKPRGGARARMTRFAAATNPTTLTQALPIERAQQRWEAPPRRPLHRHSPPPTWKPTGTPTMPTPTDVSSVDTSADTKGNDGYDEASADIQRTSTITLTPQSSKDGSSHPASGGPQSQFQPQYQFQHQEPMEQPTVASPPLSDQASPTPPLPISPATLLEQENVKRAKSSKVENATAISRVWTQDNPKYQFGKPMLSVQQLEEAGEACDNLHYFYLRASEANIKSITIKDSNNHMLSNDSYFSLSFSDIFDLLNLDAIDVGVLRCFTLHLIQEMRKTPDVPYAFLDPQHMIISQIERDRQGAVDYLAKSISHYMDKRFIMVPHNTGGHWVLLVICPMWDMVCYMDSLMRPLDEDGKPKERDYTFVRGVLNDAFAEFLATHPELNKEKNHELKHMTEFACHQQPASNLCGFFVAKNMLLTTGAKDIKYPDDFIFDTRNTEDNSVLYHIRDAIASFLVSEVIDKNGEFHYPDNNHPASVTILSGPHPEGSSSHNKDVKPRREEREAHDIAIKDAPAARVTETFASNGQQHSTDDKSSMSSQHDLADHKNSSSSRSKDEMDGDRT